MKDLAHRIEDYNQACLYNRSFLHKLQFWKGDPETLPAYEPDIHGDLVDFEIPEGYEEIERYWVDEPYVFVSILKRLGIYRYVVVEPSLSVYEKDILERTYSDLKDVLTIDETTCADSDRDIILVSKALSLFKRYHIPLDVSSKYRILYYLRRNFLGFGKINPLMMDSDIEDISCDGVDIPIYLYHRKYLNIETNISYTEDKLNSFVITLCQRSGKHISVSEPLVDATLNDGSRLQATLGKEITTRGSSFNVRKFRGDPITPVDLINFGTCNLEMMVYFWLAIENGFSAIFAGGTASGKTTMLNAISLFIPPLSKIVSIEDTREIMMYHDNWIAGVTRDSISRSGAGEVSMYDLLKSALRQRPENLIVGEVRGKEALTLFQALSTGHTTYSTMHAGDVQTVVNRLENEPINVPHVMLQSLDILCIQRQVYLDDKRVRRLDNLVEFTGIDPKSGDIRINELYQWDSTKDEFYHNGQSNVLKLIVQKKGWSPQKLREETQNRHMILEYLLDHEIRDYISISLLVKTYATSPEIVLDAIENDALVDLLQQER
ncbi:type II/IV secretion system ATPase subunit [Methanohalophilus portucalensis]|uniref:Flagellar protein FlaI n=2 Tax=Methanohalophilus portucalensis TaxID=39664 RepID=A0A1L9C2Z1_9EURY|nr:type II/IV secretion system ATPase subunit [Methanohalophilus portucalensis]ATU07685.1 secretion system protein E [Methanohalophilus portucalensis]OJH48833.1 type II secretion system protein E [Methanohalophilus portucalensis FDF-1]RNI08807.1 secretion system protein E [Methanohalophilus portucalensis FDF-1]SMH36773.1 flagellar protein FlaI [Methanohalophilus portucalensis FDF-1]